MKLQSTNPSKSYELIGEVETSTLENVVSKVTAARLAFKTWRGMSLSERVSILRNLVDGFNKDSERLAQIASQEMGMPIEYARADIASGIEYFNSYLEKADEFFKPVLTYETDSEIHEVYHEPYGVAAVIVPWNFPFSNFVWQAGQNLVAGNTVVFKHSEETPLFGKALEEIIGAYLPEGVFGEIYGDGSVGKMLIEQDINIVCFTGSSKTGAIINQSVAARFIPTNMELGGSAPGIIFADCDVEEIKESVFLNRFSNSGQMCDALKRLIVHESKFDEVVSTLAELIKTKKTGDAADEGIDIGPLVSKKQLELLESQVADAVSKGGNIVVGGKRPDGLLGDFYEPTLITNIDKTMRLWQEEVFGPVLPVISFKTEEEAIMLANDTKYGLGAYIFTRDKPLYNRVAMAVNSGMVTQNNLSYINVNDPFGGYGYSGGAREHAAFGFSEVTQVKVIAREK
ncbi:MAG: aldehyde dehydrogenase family protein [Candidatus Saccharibacteria bacterium]